VQACVQASIFARMSAGRVQALAKSECRHSIWGCWGCTLSNTPTPALGILAVKTRQSGKTRSFSASFEEVWHRVQPSYKIHSFPENLQPNPHKGPETCLFQRRNSTPHTSRPRHIVLRPTVFAKSHEQDSRTRNFLRKILAKCEVVRVWQCIKTADFTQKSDFFEVWH
jgi:hypothetical protein